MLLLDFFSTEGISFQSNFLFVYGEILERWETPSTILTKRIVVNPIIITHQKQFYSSLGIVLDYFAIPYYFKYTALDASGASTHISKRKKPILKFKKKYFKGNRVF